MPVKIYNIYRSVRIPMPKINDIVAIWVRQDDLRIVTKLGRVVRVNEWVRTYDAVLVEAN